MTADGEALTFIYSDPDKTNSYYMTIFEEFYRTSANQKILLYKNSDEAKIEGIFHKHLDANNVVIYPSSTTIMGKWYGITTTDSSYILNAVITPENNTITIPNFCDDPSKERFKVYVDGQLIELSDDIYTPQEYYGNDAVFTFNLSEGDKKYVTIDYSIERLNNHKPIITEDGLIDISNMNLPLFNSDELYINGYKYPISLLKEVTHMVYKPTTMNITSTDNIELYKYECDEDLYGFNSYKMDDINDNIFRSNNDFRNYLINK